jgi:hypothetical protein
LPREQTFLRSMAAGQTHLIIQTAAGELGFYVTGPAAWRAAIEAAIA